MYQPRQFLANLNSSPTAPHLQPGRPPVVTSHGPQEVQCADRVFYLNAQQLESAQRDPHNYRVQVRVAAGKLGWHMRLATVR